MVSSLAAQLAQSSSLNASLYVDRSRRQYAQSYLFSERDANQHDFYSLHALGLNGLLKLKALNPLFEKYENTIFSESSRNADRTLQSESQNKDLNRILDDFLKQLGPYLMETPTSKALEWVIRRFRVTEFNVDALMALFLPYHETPHFTKLVSILHIKTDLWRFLIPLKGAAQSLPRVVLMNEMVKSVDLARFAFNLLPESLEGGWNHHALVGFTAGVAVEYLARQKHIKEDVLSFVLSVASRLYGPNTNQECVLVGYTIFATLSQRCRFNPEVLTALLTEMVKGQAHTHTTQFISFAVALLAPQDQLQDLADPIITKILALPDISPCLVNCLKWNGSDKLINALLPGLLRQINNPKVLESLDALLVSSLLPDIIIQTLIRGLLPLCDPVAVDTRAIQFLRMIYQNFPSIYSQIFSNVLNEIEELEMREKVGAITRLVTLPSFALDDIGHLMLSSRLEGTNNRQHAVRELIDRLKDKDLETDIRKDIRLALCDRIFDDETSVLEILYGSPSAVLPIFEDMSFITSVAKVLASSEVSRGVMRLHFNFIAGPFYEKHNEYGGPIFENIFLPFVLFTKPRQKTAQLAWDTLKDSPFASYELLLGCKDIILKHVIREDTRIDDMASINLDICSRIAENILSSTSFPGHLDMLFRLICHTDAHTRSIAFLIARFLLNLLSGHHQIEMARRLFITMDIKSLSSLQDLVSGKANLQEIITDAALSKAVVSKPNSNTTLHRLQLAILALIPVLKRPPDITIDWLSPETSTSTDKRGVAFATLMQDVYKLVNTSTGYHLSTMLLKALFVNLREEALLLLVGVWSGVLLRGLNHNSNSEHLVQTGLSHTLAFLRAQIEDTSSPQDFQTVVPALLIALHADIKSIRSAAMDCIAAITQSTKCASASSVYAVDTVYGEKTSENLQYLEWSDFGRFMTSLESYHSHCVNDKDYLSIVSQDILQSKRSDSRKDASYKEKVLCYLLSHVMTWEDLDARVILLGMLRNISHEVKLQMLVPALRVIVFENQLQLFGSTQGSGFQYWQLLLSAYDLKAVPELSDPSSNIRDLFIKLVTASFKDDSLPPTIPKSILSCLSGNLFDRLPLDLQQECCIILVESAATVSALKPLIKENCGSLFKEPNLIVSLLSHFQPINKDVQQRASKRVKVTDDTRNASPNFLTVLAEILVAHSVPGSPELLSCALDTLAAICHGQSLQSDAHYTIQLFMTIIETMVSSISDVTKLAPNTLKMDILVELLRISDNPQTFNQALLIMASIARLTPEFVIQNVMPIFTFMGSNVFHRDDSYSFRVVQRTIDSIVPVVVDSLKKKHTEKLDLLKASSDFLRVFTDAATHVPRHRRTQFFIHLIEILGRDDFLLPVCLLLIEKSHRVVRQKASEVVTTLSLPLAIVQAQSEGPPFEIIHQLLGEAAKLHAEFIPNEFTSTTETPFHVPKDETTTKMQINTIVIFVDALLEQSVRTGATVDSASINESVVLLLGFANAQTSDSNIPQYLDVSRISVKALNHLLGVISVSEFVSSISVILEAKNPLAEVGALDLLASRLTNVAPKTRSDVAPIIVNIIDRICWIIEKGEDIMSMKAALAALQAVAQSAVDQEIPSLTKALPLTLKAANRINQLTAVVLKCIMPLSIRIGPRVLPAFRDVVKFCSDLLRDAPKITDEKEKHSLIHDAQANLINLLTAIPQFWTIDDLKKLILLMLESSADTLTLRKIMVKRVSSKQVLTALLRVWSSSIPNPSKEIFFDLVKRTMRNSERPVVHENLRDIFKMFLEAFEDLQVVKKGLVTPYMDVVLNPSLELLDSLQTKLNLSLELWTALIELFDASLVFDESAFWRVEKLNQLGSSLVKQLAVVPSFPISYQAGSAQILQTCLNNLFSIMEDDLSLKKLHVDILMQTRSEDSGVKLFTLQTLISLWESQGEKLIGFLTDILTFIVECAEDEDDEVAKAARSLKRAVEKRAGNLDVLMGK
ncbi:hypothetical protein Clacol_003560 [Clathrus columnatus]|uniref:U3 small nucleolar RNA-associated protein 10 n=1 Tax=Clathrus columnatus TaxID=1419009 RepID=A0AAV5A805_9AGAM|nr:hypothetical protein Clacol_003560 [Clathrus columnatus]